MSMYGRGGGECGEQCESSSSLSNSSRRKRRGARVRRAMGLKRVDEVMSGGVAAGI